MFTPVLFFTLVQSATSFSSHAFQPPVKSAPNLVATQERIPTAFTKTFQSSTSRAHINAHSFDLPLGDLQTKSSVQGLAGILAILCNHPEEAPSCSLISRTGPAFQQLTVKLSSEQQSQSNQEYPTIITYALLHQRHTPDSKPSSIFNAFPKDILGETCVIDVTATPDISACIHALYPKDPAIVTDGDRFHISNIVHVLRNGECTWNHPRQIFTTLSSNKSE